MAAITRALIATVWTTTYPGPLETAVGKMVTRSGYADVFAELDGVLRLPWSDDPVQGHWSRFWAYYLGKPERVRGKLDTDAAWDRVVPVMWAHGATIAGPAGGDAKADVLVYPSAIAVVVRIDVSGVWPLDRLAESLAALRVANDWSLKTGEGTSRNRNLDGIAKDLRDRAALLLTWGTVPEPGQQEVLTVAAPAADDGDIPSFDLTDKTASACLAGLAGLGPPAPLNEKYLLAENSHPRHVGRVYVLKTGHAIWHTTYIRDQPRGDPILCLHRNQTNLVAHISALTGIVRWAADQAAVPGGIAAEVQPLVKRAVERLEQLHSGTVGKTYRSGIAKVRIEPLVETLNAVKASL